MPANPALVEGRILLMPPTRRDGDAIAALLAEARIACDVCRSVPDLCTEINAGCAAVMISEEALLANHDVFADCVSQQPMWSDLPIVVLSRTGLESPALSRIMARLGNISVLERPVRLTTLLSVVRTLLRARERQYQMRDHLAARERAEQELRHSREQLELVVKGARVGVWYCPLPFDKLIWDETVKEHFHLPPDAEPTIDEFFERLHPDDRERIRRAIDVSIADRRPYDVDYRTVSPDGQQTKWIRASGRGFYDDSGNPLRFDGITIDVTERVNAQRALQQSEQRLRAVVEATPDCVKIVAPDGSLLYMNATGVAMIEADDVNSVAGACVYDLISPEHRREWIDRHERICSGEKMNWQYEIVGLRGARRWMETHAVPIPLRGGVTGQLAVIRDITERKQAELERERLLESEKSAREEAERAGQMKDEFLATLSHELRTPLSAILGWSQMLQLNMCGPEEVVEGVNAIERNARVQTQIIEDLLDMSRIISGKIRLDAQPVDLAAILRASIDTVRPAAEARGIELVLVSVDAAATAYGDPNRLQQVFWNLLSNAVKFTPKGGSVSVGLRRTGSQLEVAVVDSGEGIDPEFLPHVFDRFRQGDATTTRRHGGLGLGLAIVKQLVELHGGTIRATSEGLGRGSHFTVLLPIAAVRRLLGSPAERSAAVGAPPAERPSLQSLAGLRILIVDDEADARGMLQRMLENCHATVVAASSAENAFAELPSAHPDVIVSDVGMPGEDGYSLIRRIRALPPDQGGRTPAIAMTAYAREEDRAKALAAGFQHHLAKPVDAGELLKAIVDAAGRTI